MTEPIRGKVAKILNSREIAINKGTENGVTIGMYFDVLDPHYENIEDPDTQEVLGSFQYPKVRVRVTLVEEKLALATTYRGEQVNIGGSSKSGSSRALDAYLGPFAESLMTPKWIMKYETLRKTEKANDELDEKDSYVKIGDPVVQITDQSEIEQENIYRTQRQREILP